MFSIQYGQAFKLLNGTQTWIGALCQLDEIMCMFLPGVLELPDLLEPPDAVLPDSLEHLIASGV